MDTIDLTIEDMKSEYTSKNLVDNYFTHRNKKQLPIQSTVTRKYMNNLNKTTLLTSLLFN